MSISYQADNELVLGCQLKVQTLHLPFVVTGNATAANVTVTRDDPSILFIKTQGVDQITAALASSDTPPTYTAANDSSGVFNILISIGEQIKKVVRASVIRMDTPEGFQATYTSTPATGIVAGGAQDKICLNATSPTAFTSGTHQFALEVSYVVSET